MDDKVIEEVALTVLEPTLLQVEPLATVTGGGALCGWKLEFFLRTTRHVICGT